MKSVECGVLPVCHSQNRAKLGKLDAKLILLVPAKMTWDNTYALLLLMAGEIKTDH